MTAVAQLIPKVVYVCHDATGKTLWGPGRTKKNYVHIFGIVTRRFQFFIIQYGNQPHIGKINLNFHGNFYLMVVRTFTLIRSGNKAATAFAPFTISDLFNETIRFYGR